MRNIAIPITALAAFAASCQATATLSDERSDDKVWVTIGSDALAVVESSLAGSVIDSRERADGVALVEVESSAIPELTHLMHEEFMRCGGYIVHDSQKDAVGSLKSELARSTMHKAFADYSIDNGQVVETLIGQVDEGNIVQAITALSNFHTRYYTTQSGVDAAVWIRDTWQGYIQGRADASVELYEHSNWRQPSVILTIEGDQFPDEVVVLGGHLDSTAGWGGNSRAPGADDDASGIATLGEIIRVAMANDYKPDRTVKFMGYAAEEVGLRGSRAIAQSFQSQGINVVGVLQLDMTNYKGSTEDIALLDDYTNAQQNQFISQLIDTYLNLRWTMTTCGYACSDHASWTNAGYPASMPFEARMGQHNRRIHTAQDTLAQSGGNAQHAVKFAKLGAAYLAELAKGALDGGGTNPPPPPPVDPVTETFSDSVARGENDFYGPFSVEPGSNYTAQTTGTGDADLYVRFGAQPTTSAYDCRPYKNGSAETCSLIVPASQTQAFVMIRGYSSATYDLSVTYRPDSGSAALLPSDSTSGPITETFSGSPNQQQEQSYEPFAAMPGSAP
ncbi:MAG: M20/M25/M40 family metallo-hydrolase [Proteobacteria bacterium]|nr:M20/M25/M40 family metallo-hydrolase [Pseudomonadota bacterium]